MSNPLGDLISRGEGSYNSYNRGTANGRIVRGDRHIDFAQMSLGELQRLQALPQDDPDRIFAVGKYQLIPKTLKSVVDDLGLQASERYTPELQERIFAEALIVKKRHQIYDYIRGVPSATLHDAQKATCKEWASVDDPDTPGKPYKNYGQQGNHSSISSSQVADALNQMRMEYRVQVNSGATPRDAWRFITGQVRAPAQEAALQPPQVEANSAHQPGETNATISLQRALQHLGYSGLHERPLVLDGHIGPNTLHAIKSFQHAHHLHVDGVIGPRTLAALEDAQHYPLLSEATNPHHHLYQQVFDGIHRLPHGQQPRGRELENATVALTMSAQQSGLHKVDHIVLGSYGVNLFAVQGRMDDPGHRRTHVELAHAAAHAVDHRSMSTVQYVPEHAHAMAVAQQQVEPRAPVMMGP